MATLQKKAVLFEKEIATLRKQNEELSLGALGSGAITGPQKNEQRIKLLNKVKEENHRLKEEKASLLNQIVKFQVQLEKKGKHNQAQGQSGASGNNQEAEESDPNTMSLELDVLPFQPIFTNNAV